MSALLWADVALIHAMLLGQTIFLVLWGSLPWWREWVGRALMIKSFALWVLIAFAVGNFWVVYKVGAYPAEEAIAVGTHVLILIGIWSQVIALSFELAKAHRIRAEISRERLVTCEEQSPH